eukprot:CAMPEP_0174233664 /NCGR_PEP_ID=MMETSP0417-20130205/3647_1 /TAXON_ID=242541 /ORGANISM="Mayorella sp, Strain BSH-02190019" /LENGTH=91 /DNA_ID=CAMNT_0015311915 /DNA_START=64 /DNA_END=336 /DNA_ORIENTATION=-
MSTETASTSDLAYFLDFDLAILGARATCYAKYAAQIRSEYAHIPEAAYCDGRVAVLRRFLDTKRFVLYRGSRYQTGAVCTRQPRSRDRASS